MPTSFILISIGFLAVLLAWSLFYRSTIIFKLNEWIRENVFNDELLLFSKNRIAILLLVLGVVSLFSGIDKIARNQTLPPRITARLLAKAQESLANKDYQRVVNLCQELVSSNPKDVLALDLMATAYSGLNNKDKAQEIYTKIVSIDPQYVARHQSHKRQILRKKKDQK